MFHVESRQPIPRQPRPRERALGVLLLAYVLTVTVLVTLVPFRFAWVDAPSFSGFITSKDVILNLFLLFAPGFLYQLTFGGLSDRWCGRALVLGFLFSLGLESLQLFLPGRYSSPIDVAANTAGAWAGALVGRRIGERLLYRRTARLALELPLMNIFYLLVPLLWLNGLAGSEARGRLALSPALGLFGSLILVSVWRNHLHRSRSLNPRRLGGVVCVWYLVASLPALLHAPFRIVMLAFVLALVAWTIAETKWLLSTKDRRFEALTLRRAAPLYATYLVAMALWPWSGLGATWRGHLAFAALPDEPGFDRAFAMLEYVAAFTLLGYMLAEARGRRSESLTRSLRQVTMVALACATALELARGFHTTHRASLTLTLMLTTSAVWGAAIYRSQLATIRRLLGR